MLELPRLELATALLTGGAAITLIPHRRNLIVSAAEAMVWVGFVLASALCIATIGDPRFQEATASIAWGGIALVRLQVSFVMGILGGWTAAHRFMIANWVAIAAGAGVLALVFMHTARTVRRSAPRVHLGEWFELPRRVARPVAVPAVDPLAVIDRRLAHAASTELQLVKQKIETSPALARAAVGTAHLLGPGHLRLRMVKLALAIRMHREVLAEETAHARPASSATPEGWPAASVRVAVNRSRNGKRGHTPNRRKAGSAAYVIPMPAAQQSPAAAVSGTGKKRSTRAPAVRDRVAS